MRDKGDIVHSGYARPWHPWLDSPGVRSIPAIWVGGNIATASGRNMFHCETAEDLLNCIAKNELFVFCQDILSTKEFPMMNQLLGLPGVSPFLSESGGIPAMRLKCGKTSGYLVQTSTWGWNREPDARLLENLSVLWAITGFQSTTPASLSEKVLRSTLPAKLGIRRPSLWLRQHILNNNVGGRIDRAEIGKFYKKVWSYDKNKAYLYHSRYVPSPFLAPISLFQPSLDEVLSYPSGWWDCQLVAQGAGIPPIQIDGKYPRESQAFRRWLWTGELQDCLESGYRLASICRGYGFPEMSNWMEPWSELLWNWYNRAYNEDPFIQKNLKSMMVGVPGRFLRKPKKLLLVPRSPHQEGNIPLTLHTSGDEPIISEWAMREEDDLQSTALCVQGSYIVAEMRRELFRLCKQEEEKGNRMVRTYVDSVAFEEPMSDDNLIGMELGQYKMKEYSDVWTEENRFVGQRVRQPWEWEDDEFEMKAPGYGAEKRIELWQKYHQIREKTA